RDWREPRPADPPAADRKPGAVGDRRRAGTGGGLVPGQARAGARRARFPAPRRCGDRQNDCRVYRGGVAVRGALVGVGAGAARGMPGVVAACGASSMPLDRATQLAGFPSPWTPRGGAPATARAVLYVVTPGYAEALGLRLKSGRLFRDSDVGSEVRPWIVNEEF